MKSILLGNKHNFPEPCPQLNMWMLNEISYLLFKEEQARIHRATAGADVECQDVKDSIAEMKKNKFHYVGKISQTIKRIEEIKEYYTSQFQNKKD